MTRCQRCGALWRGPHQCKSTYEELLEYVDILERQLDATQHELGQARCCNELPNDTLLRKLEDMQHDLEQAQHCQALIGADLLNQIREGSEIMQYLKRGTSREIRTQTRR